MNFWKFIPAMKRIGTGASLAAVILTGAVAATALPASNAYAANEKAQEIANHFAEIKTMTGDFVQFGPRGQQSGGKFFLERPGKIRFNYDAPSPIRVISDGKALVVGNRKLSTWDVYPLSKTPLALLLGKSIDLSGSMVRSIKQEDDLVTVVLGDKTVFGDSTITMMFDPKTDDLRQWTITDPQGKETTIMIYNVQAGVKFADNVFKVPYALIRESQSKR